VLVLPLCGCSTDDPPDDAALGTGTGSTPTTAASTATSGTGSSGGAGSPNPTTAAVDSTSSDSSPPGVFDVGSMGGETTGPAEPVCTVVDDMDAVGPCRAVAPADSFDPEIQWEWAGQGVDTRSIVTPLVANLTDDNADGEIDLCDIPDVVVVAAAADGSTNTPGHIYVLDGNLGTLHFQVPTAVDHSVTPALADIDNDGLPEIVSAVVGGNLVAFEHDGTLKWQSASPWAAAYSGAVAIADIDHDGDIEIVAGNQVYDHLGVLLWTAPTVAGNWSATTIADLDDVAGMEIVLGHAAYHADGTQYYNNPAVSPGYPQVANLDGDPEPEVLVNNANGITVLEHNGTIKYADLRPTGDPQGGTTWLRPATVHDFTGDGIAEFAVSSANHYTVYNPDATIVWSALVADPSGIAAGTAFDFLGDGRAEAMYADQTTMFAFDEDGIPLLEIPRTSGTLSEYPVVVDVDNDGSAEVVVVSNMIGGDLSPTVQVIRDVEDRWIQPRRIWNQHTYHVTNVREDGTIPMVEPKSWTLLNTFRTNAQIEGGGLCVPRPEG